MGRNIADEYKQIIGGATSKPSERSVGPETGDNRRGPIHQNCVEEWKPKEYRPCAKYVDGVLTELRITSTLIKRLFFKGEPRQGLCPKKEYHHMLKADIKIPPTEIMMRGLLYEAICFKDKLSEEYYERKLRLNKGTQSVHTQRIYEQSRIFDLVASKYEISIENTQVPLHGDLEIEKFGHIKFSLEGTADIVSPVNSPGFSHNKAIIDLKLTLDRNSEFGEYCYGSPQYLDMTQGSVYSFLSGSPFALLVFDYRSKDRGHLVLPIATMAMFPDGQPTNPELMQHYNVARDRFTDLKVVIKDTAYTILRWDAEGYKEEPSFEACKNCVLSPVNNLGDGPKCSVASYTNII